MSYASRSGHAKTDPQNPKAFAVCDRCSRWWNHCELSWQYEWRGNELVDIRLLVCRECYDIPFELDRPLYLPPDPPPVDQPRPEAFAIDEASEDWDQSGLYWDSGLNWTP